MQKEELKDLMNVSHALLIGMSDHPCLKVCCEKKDCSVGSLLRGNGSNTEWNKLLTIPPELKSLSRWHPRSVRDKNKENKFKRLKQEYYSSRRVLMQAQSSFKSRQKVEFAALLKVQLKMKSELKRYREKADRIEHELKVFLEGSDAYKKIASVDKEIKSNHRDSNATGPSMEDKESTFTCPDGFELKEWLKLPAESKRIVLDQFKNAVSLEIAKHLPDNSNTKEMKEEEEDDDDVHAESFEDDIALLESEALEIASNSKNMNDGGKKQNLAEVVEMNVNNMSRRIRVRYIQSRETEVVNTSEVTMSRSSHGDASKGVNKYIVRPMKQNDEITTLNIVGLQSLEGYDDDDENRQDEKNEDEDEEEKRSEENVDSSEMSKKKSKSGKKMDQLARERYLVVKTNGELSCVLHISSGVMEAPKPVKLDANVRSENVSHTTYRINSHPRDSLNRYSTN